MSNTHIRLNRATREWVIYAPGRQIRPQTIQENTVQANFEPNFNANCPFCKPLEESQEQVLLEIPASTAPDWLVRVVTNKFPALSPGLKPKRSLAGIYLELPGYGHHELVVEGPAHNQTLATLPEEYLTAMVKAYRLRYHDLLKIQENLFVIIFRNHGKRAGASLPHPHSQIIATPIVPRHYRWREDEAQRYYDEWGRCAYCDILESEMEDRQRVVGENEHFLAFVPYAAEVPYEIWIVPKDHESDFGNITPDQEITFARLLQLVLTKLYSKLQNPDYNYAIMSAARFKSGEPQLHWYCQIRPRLTTAAGFEMGSGISINPSLPEKDAAFLNEQD